MAGDKKKGKFLYFFLLSLAGVLITVLRLKNLLSPHETVKFFIYDLLIAFSLLFYLKRNVIRFSLLQSVVVLSILFFSFSVFKAVNISVSIIWTFRFIGTVAFINILTNLLRESIISREMLLDVIYISIIAFVCYWMIDNYWMENEIPLWKIKEAPHIEFLYFSSVGTKEYTAQIFSVFFPVIIYFISQIKELFLKLINIILLIVLVQIMFLSHSRGILISLLCSSIVVGLLSKKSRIVFYFLGGIILLFILNLAFFSYNIKTTIDKIQSSKDVNQLSGQRINIYLNTLEMIKDNPMGVGAGNFEYIHPLYAKACTISASPAVSPNMVLSDPHNIFLKMFSELGYGGGVLFILLFLYLSFIAIKNTITGGRIDGILCVSWISLVIHAMFSAVFLTPVTLFFGSIIIAMIFFSMDNKGNLFWAEIKIPRFLIIIFSFFSAIIFCAIFASEYYLSKGIKNKDIEGLKYSLLINPNNERSYYELAVNSLLREERPEDALKYINRFLSLYPYHLGGLGLKADILFSMKEYDKAEEIIFQSLNLCPEFSRMKTLLNHINSEKNHN